MVSKPTFSRTGTGLGTVTFLLNVCFFLTYFFLVGQKSLPKNIRWQRLLHILKVYILVYLHFTSLISKNNYFMSLRVGKTCWLLAECHLTNAICKVLVLIWRNLVANSRAPISFFNSFPPFVKRNEFPWQIPSLRCSIAPLAVCFGIFWCTVLKRIIFLRGKEPTTVFRGKIIPASTKKYNLIG